MEREEVSTRPRYENVKDNNNGLHQGSRGGVSKAHPQGKTRSDSTSSMNPGAPRQVRFHVAFCSGEDPEFPAEELNVHSPQTRGWQSPAFCAYPQEIGLEFVEGEVQLSQLQILSHESKIATKIDVYVGRGDDYSTCSFKRLGHLSLDNNERSDFAARELKSVYVGKQGNFLKLLIHKCHLNRHNIYNQAGVIAINVLGLSVPPGQSYASGEQGSRYVAPVPKSVPPLQDLAFDMNFDKETAETMRQLHQVKERAVQDEDFEFAKEIKHAEDQLKQLGVQVAGLENAKRSAVQREDYDEASAVKHEIQAIRADIAGLTAHLLGTNLNNGGNRSSRMQNGGMHDLAHVPNNRGGGMNNGQLMESIVPNGNQFSDSIGSNGREPETAGQHAPSHIPSLPHLPGQPQMQAQQQSGFGFQPAYASPGHETPTHQNYIGEDERPLPVLQKSPGQHSARSFHGNRSGSAIPTSFPGNPVQEELVDGEANATDPEVIAKALHSVPGYEDLPEAETLPVGLANETQPLVDVFDEYLVRCLYSRQVKLRSAALTALENRIDEYSMPESRIFAAFVSVCRLVVNDKNTNVYLQGIKVLELVIARASSLKRSDMQSLEPLARPIVEKLGNNTSRLRVASEAALMNMAHQRNIGPQFVANSVLRPTRQGKTLLWRLLLGRVRVVSELVREYGMRDELGLGLETVMEYVRANNALAHPHAEVRETTKELLMQAYTHVGEAVMPYLTDLRPKQLEEYQLGFQELDGGVRVTSETRKETRSSPKHQKSRQQQPPDSARSGRSSARSTSRAGTQSPTNRDINININVSHDQEGQASAAGDENLDLEEVEPFTCQFCERHDPSFTEDALDMHYWKECPMLTSCVQCEQVIEVALLNDHLLHECENKDNHKKCPRCNEAIASQFLDQHVQRGTCLVSKPLSQANRCPLCHEDFKPGPEGWKEHILAGKGCPKNPRTLYLR